MNEYRDDLIGYRVNRAVETLREAEIMINNGCFNAAVNRLYYACYYIVTALLLEKSIEAASHKRIRQMFGLHFVNTGLVSKEDGRFFSDLYDRRQTGDYDDFVSYDEKMVERLFIRAGEFVGRMIALAKG